MDNFIITALTLLSLILLGWVFYLKYKAKYTREKYAFAALFAFLSLATLGVNSVLYQTPWAAMIKVIAHFIGVEITIAKLQWSEQVLIIVFISYIIGMIQRTFSQWNGVVSLNQHEQQKRHDEVLFVYEGWQELRRKYKNKPELAPYDAPDHDKQVSALNIPSEGLSAKILKI